MDVLPYEERVTDGWPPIDDWISMILYWLMGAYINALGKNDSYKSLLDQIQKGIQLIPIILDPDSQRFKTPDGQDFTDFGHPTESLYARALDACAGFCGMKTIILVPKSSVALPWCDLIQILYTPDGDIFMIRVLEVKCNRSPTGANDPHRLGTHAGNCLLYTSPSPRD